jgi:hypothetical protein
MGIKQPFLFSKKTEMCTLRFMPAYLFPLLVNYSTTQLGHAHRAQGARRLFR